MRSYEVLVGAEPTRKFAEAIEAVRAGWDAAPAIEAAPMAAPPKPLPPARKAAKLKAPKKSPSPWPPEMPYYGLATSRS
jgi:hypothetical protein